MKILLINQNSPSMRSIYYSIFCLIFLSSCASIAGFEEGRSNGKGNGTAIASLNYSRTPDLDTEDGDEIIDLAGAPFLEISGRYGLTEKLDFGVKVNTFLNLGANVKYQLVGDRQSPFALGTGLEFGLFGGINIWNIQVPLYTSFYPSDKLCVYVTPKYIYQTAGFGNGGANYVGANAGFLFGSRHKFGIDFAYYRVGTAESSAGLLNFGIGGKFLFGDN